MAGRVPPVPGSRMRKAMSSNALMGLANAGGRKSPGPEQYEQVRSCCQFTG